MYNIVQFKFSEINQLSKKIVKRRKTSKNAKRLTVLLTIIVVLVVIGVVGYSSMTSAPNNDETIVPFTVAEGATYSSVGEQLKAEGFIKSELAYKIYIKIHKPEMLYAGKYPLSKAMSLTEVVELIASGKTYTPDAKYVTFPEGKNMRSVAKIIENNTIHSYEDVFELLSDEDYLDSIIEKYWFLTDEIKNSDIYYSLEGYLYPETYQLTGEDMPLKDIFGMMLDQLGRVLEPYKADIENSGYTLHQMLTMASIVELEAGSANDRAGVAGVFYNRLNDGWSLGSDVTTYYAAKVDMSERDLYMSEINDANAYNTRSDSLAGKLPVGPICNPSINSIIAAIEPANNDYYYFVADKYGDTYFSYTYTEHENTVTQLKNEGLWFEYE